MAPPDDIRQLRSQATAGARWTALATTTRIITQFVQIAILARLLTVDDFGLFEMISVAVVFGQAFGDAGISNAIIHYQDATRRELSSLYWLNVLSGVVVGGLFLAAIPLIAGFYREPRLTSLLAWAAPVFVVTPVGHQFQVLLERELQFRRVALIEMVAVILATVVGVVMALGGYGVLSLVAVLLGHAGTKAVLLAIVGWRRWRPSLHMRWSECRRFLWFGVYQMGERIVNLMGQQLDKILIAVMLGSEAVGYYGLAYRLIARPYQLINPIFTRVAFPVFSRVQSDMDRMRKGFLELIEVVAALLIPLYAVLAALAKPVIMVQLGPGYEPCIELLQILCLLGIFYALGNPFGSVLLALGRPDVGLYMNLTRIALFGGAIAVGARFGLTGIAWGLVIAIGAVMFPVGLWIRWWLMRMPAPQYLARLGAPAVVSVVVGLLVWFVDARVAWPNVVVELVVLGPVFAAGYLGGLHLVRRSLIGRVLSLVRS